MGDNQEEFRKGKHQGKKIKTEFLKAEVQNRDVLVVLQKKQASRVAG